MMRLLVISFADPRDRAVEQFARHSPRSWVRDVIVSLFYHWFNNPRPCAGRGMRSEAIGLPASRRRVAPAILLGTDFGDDRTFRPDSGGNYPIPRNEAPIQRPNGRLPVEPIDLSRERKGLERGRKSLPRREGGVAVKGGLPTFQNPAANG